MIKFLLFANTDWYLYNYRLDLAKELQNRGSEVVFASPPGPYVEKMELEGFGWRQISLSRWGWNPLAELFAILNVWRLYRDVRPDLVHQFTIKPVIYGSLAASWIKIPAVINSITGLGYLYANHGPGTSVLRALVKPFYRTALNLPQSHAIFQNSRDQELFVDQGLVQVHQSSVIPGSGVDHTKFSPTPEPPGKIVVLLISRMLWEKGVREFVEAIRELRARGFTGRGILVGGVDPGYPSSVPEKQLVQWNEEGTIEWIGHRDDIDQLLQRAHVVVLPSFYGEGLPKALLEACSAGKPVVATDIPGCRDIVDDGYNGFIIPPKDSSALAKAIEQLWMDAKLRESMGAAGRQRVLEGFTTDQVNRRTIARYERSLGRAIS